MILFCWVDLHSITIETHHKQVNSIAFCTLLANFILNIFNHAGILGGGVPDMFISFNGLIFALTTIILISGKKHGVFKNKYEND